MEKIKDFRELIVWQKAHELFLAVVKDIEQFPHIQAAQILSDQLLRACSSISANIAEGFGRRQGKEYVHYLIIARGSATETLNWLVNCLDPGWLDKRRFIERENLLQEILKMLNKMIAQKLIH